MRSSKSRSRSKSNRPRTLGNITNRVFDSSGPEGKVRGTPQQIIDKYLIHARDSQLSNDRVAAENFMQHAEHYTRMLAEAMREQVAEQEVRRLQDLQQQQQNQQHQQNQQNQQRDRQERQDRNYNAERGEGAQPDVRSDQRDEDRQQSNRGDYRSDTRSDQRPEQRSEQRAEPRNDHRNDARSDDRRDRRPDRDAPKPVDDEVIGSAVLGDDNGLVETPEAKRAPRNRQQNKPVRTEAQTVAPAEAVAEQGAPPPVEQAKPRRPRVPRKPKAGSAPEVTE
jgi:hypothetical protein